jgi:glucose/arabinose dehydrogenase
MKKIYTAIILLLLFTQAHAQPTIGFQPIATGLTVPLDIVSPGGTDTRLFIVQQDGRIKIWNGTSVLATAFLDVSSITNYDMGERGLLSLAFHPNYATNRYFFIYYNNLAGNVIIARYQTKAALPNEADPTSGVILMSIPKPFTNHNGGKLNFGPDGYLYFGTGDGGSGGDPNNNAQTGTSYLGKMLRIDVNNFTTAPYYSVPPTNPYTTNPNINDEIIAVGLRNPFRWSFDRQTGDMWIADVGQNLWEELNFKPASSILDLNYGWRCFEGTHVYNNTCSAQPNNVVPIFEYGHNNTTGGFSITGGYVYRGTEYSFLQGYYICADFSSRNFWLTKSNGSGGWTTTQSSTQTPTGIAGFGEALDGTLYAAGLSNGTIYKVTATAPVPLKLLSFTGKKINGTHQLNWEVASQTKGDRFIIERSFDNASFTEVGNKVAETDRNKEAYSFIVSITNNSTVFYRIKLLNKDGSFAYSPTISFKQETTANDVKAHKNGSTIFISASININAIQVTDACGRILLTKNINAMGTVGLDANQFPAGLLFINVLQNKGNTILKLVN